MKNSKPKHNQKKSYKKPKKKVSKKTGISKKTGKKATVLIEEDLDTATKSSSQTTNDESSHAEKSEAVVQPLLSPFDTFTVSRKQQTSDPIILFLKNASDYPQQVKVFDQKSKYGKVNHKYVHVYPAFDHQTYADVLNAIAHNNCKIGHVRVTGAGKGHIRISQVSNHIVGKNYISNERILLWLDAYQQQSDIVEGKPSGAKLDEGTHWEFEIPANTTWELAVYPITVKSKKKK